MENKTLVELKKQEVEKIKQRPAISIFRDNMSLGAILEKAYVVPKFHMIRCNADCYGISQVFNDYCSNNIVFIGEGGTGKTSLFLRLYMGLDKNCFDTEFYYCFAPDLIGSKRSLNAYQKELRRIIENNSKLNGILLLDGLEEAYITDNRKAGEKLQQLCNLNFPVWVSCRPNFYKRLDDKSDNLFTEKIKIETWMENDRDTFIYSCLENNDKREIIEKRIELLKQKNKDLLFRPLFATMALFVAENEDIENVDNEYSLIGFFLNKWLERDKKDKKNKKNKATIEKGDYSKLSKIALDIYLKKKELPKYSKELIVFRDLFVMSRTNDGTIHGFLHREFLVFFIVHALIDSALNQPKDIVWWFSQTFYDDITNVIKPVLLKENKEDIQKMYENLFSVYKQSYENKDEIVKQLKNLKLDPDKDILKLRDEILYFIFKLPGVDYNGFAEYAYQKYLDDNCSDTMLYLGIAYGMASVAPSNSYTLEFAKKLVPGSAEEIRNRGWGMCFFGDVEDDGYTYIDKELKPWKRVRENKLKRLSDDVTKYKTRVLDLPLLYCFYYSREFADCTSYKDFQIIKNTNITLDCFSKEQRNFLEVQKKQLVSEYEKNLLSKSVNNWTWSIVRDMISKEGIKMKKKDDKITIEISQEYADKIEEQTKYIEDVTNNITEFWNIKGKAIIQDYKPLLQFPDGNNIDEEAFKKNMKECQVIIISANSVEAAVISSRLIEASGIDKMDTFPYKGHLFQFTTLETVKICYICATNTASFTRYGSFSALQSALELSNPIYVISLGVAFGVDPNGYSLGDVLVSKNLVFYDHFNKVTDGKIKLDSKETYEIDANLISQLHKLDTKKPPEEVGSFYWYFGDMLSGATVFSDAAERCKFVDAASRIECTLIGGEMEASGVYYACQKERENKIPFLVIKGICDWGAAKNGWDKIIEKAELTDCEEKIDGETIKDCVQAYACDNAFRTALYLLKQLNFSLSVNNSKTQTANESESDTLKSKNPKQQLKKHDEELMSHIQKDMDLFLDLADEKLDLFFKEDFKFMKELDQFLSGAMNRFTDATLEELRNNLHQAIRRFNSMQALRTYQFFLANGNDAYCTKMYLIETCPEMCPKNNMPYVTDPDSYKNKKQIAPFKKERDEYQNAAFKVKECYEELGNKYLELVD